MTDFLDDRPPVPPEELDAAERRLAELGFTLPPSYRRFLAERDGGHPTEGDFDYERDGQRAGSTVQYLLGVAPDPDGDLVADAEMLAGRVLPGLLPIGSDPVGNALLLDAREGGDGPVYLWDHERESEPPDERDVAFVAKSFPAFLDGLYTAPPPPSAETPKGRRSLFRR